MMWKRPLFCKRVTCIIIDEAHTIDLWGSTFRTTYHELRRLYLHLAPKLPRVQWFLTSATLNVRMVDRILNTLNMPMLSLCPSRKPSVQWLQRSNERLNLYYAVYRMKHTISSCEDLAFLVPANLSSSDPPPPQFLVYCNSRNDAMRAARFMHARVSSERKKVASSETT